jgi:signal transduction histidine kinase
MMTHTATIVTTAALWALGGGLVAWLLTIPLRRSFAGQLARPVIISTAATIAAIWGSERSMFYASGDFRVAIIVAIFAAVVSAVMVFFGAHSFLRDKRALQQAVEAIGDGRRPEDIGNARMPTELARLRRQLDDAARRLAEASERERSLEASRRELIAWVSHDLRTPLAGLRAMTEALEDGIVESPERYYKQIRAEVDTLAEMVDDLFQLSRIQAGALRLSTERISVGDIVSDAVAALEPLAMAHGVKLTGSSSTPALVLGDSKELNRALTNIVVNAIRHTREGGTVRVEVRPSAYEDGTVEVAVADECGGIPPEQLGRVFEVGFRGEPARTPGRDIPGGAGLGLAITRGIVEAHHGGVGVQNLDDGCQFAIRLPVAA